LQLRRQGPDYNDLSVSETQKAQEINVKRADSQPAQAEKQKQCQFDRNFATVET